MKKILLFVAVALIAGAVGFFIRPAVMPPKAAVKTVEKPSVCLPSASKFGEGRKEAESYMRSGQRYNCYKSMWGAAGKVAKALLAGKFGPIEKYDEWKKPLKSDYVGWGGMQTLDKKYYAWVYWKNGEVNLKKGVKGFMIDALVIEQDDKEDPYTSLLTADDGTMYSVSLRDFNSGVTLPGYRVPTTVDELIKYDGMVLDTLAAKMNAAKL